MIDSIDKVFHPRCNDFLSRLLPRGAHVGGTSAKTRLLGERLDQETLAESRSEMSGGAKEGGE